MPAVLDRCVSKLLSSWKAKPGSRPKAKMVGGKPQDARSQAFAICTASLKGAGKLESLEEWGNPVTTGLALTNRPHIKGLDPISFVEEGEQKLLKIPLLLLGKWKHHTGILDFTEEVIGRLIKAFEGFVVGHDLSLDNRHRPELGAMAWIKRFGLETRADGKKQFSAYGEPTPEGVKAVEEKRYRYASIEFHPDWKSPLLAAFSSDDLEPYVKEAIVPEEIIVETDEKETDEKITGFEAQLEEQKKAHLKAIELEEKKRKDLEERLTSLEALSMRQFVSNILLQAEQYRDEDGRAHSKPLMDWARLVLLEEPIGEDDKVIKLEDRDDAAQTRGYYRKSIAHLLEILPGIVPMTAAGTEPDQTRSLEEGSEEDPTDEDIQSFWEA